MKNGQIYVDKNGSEDRIIAVCDEQVVVQVVTKGNCHLSSEPGQFYTFEIDQYQRMIDNGEISLMQ